MQGFPPLLYCLLTDFVGKGLKGFARDGNNPFGRKMTDDEYAATKGPTWGLGGALSQEDLPSGRKKGSLTWSGMASTYCTSFFSLCLFPLKADLRRALQGSSTLRAK